VSTFSNKYPASNEHAPYFHLWPAQLYSIFPFALKTARFSKENLVFSKFLSETF